MKELNLVEKLKRCPKWVEIYSTISGYVRFNHISDVGLSRCINTDEGLKYFEDGTCNYYDGEHDTDRVKEQVLFPNSKKGSWDLFHYALAGEYVTVVALNRKGKEIKYICQVENDGVFNVESGKTSKSNGVIGKNLVEVRAAIKEEIAKLNPEPKFKKGDIVVASYGGFSPTVLISDIDYTTGECNTKLGTDRHYVASIDRIRFATQDEINEWKEKLRSKYNVMLKDGEIVPWRAERMKPYFVVSDFGKICDTIDSYSYIDNRRYKLHERDIYNYFATEKLAKESPIYKAFHN